MTVRAKTGYSPAMTIRLQHRKTREYLHLSGAGTVKGTGTAWIGYKRQARTLRERALVAGQTWPFKAVLA